MTVSSTPASTRPGLDRCPPAGSARWRGWHGWTVLAVWLLLCGPWGLARADAPQITQMALQRSADGLYLNARLALEPSPAVEEALLKGVALYFVWQADVMRDRWYWTDKRVATAVRTLRLVYQPLTRRWRLSLATDSGGNSGGASLQYALHQNFDNLADALASVGRVAQWKLVDAARLDTDSDERVEWSFRLDLGLLPRPFQIGMANQAEWLIEVQRSLPVPRHVEGAEASAH